MEKRFEIDQSEGSLFLLMDCHSLEKHKSSSISSLSPSFELEERERDLTVEESAN